MLRMTMAVMAFAAAQAAPAQETPAPPETLAAAPNYADPHAWLCRPGVDDGTCSLGLDAVAIDAQGKRTPAPYVAATVPAIDCFYVYPTTSHDPGTFSDLNPGPEERRTTQAQAARLGSVCRLFVPLYRQYTITALRRETAGNSGRGSGKALPFETPYRDILAAWRRYLVQDNKGRGVVLVGHSQGAILLKRLIAEEIDGKPVQKHLVAAYLAGNPDLTVSSFRSIKPCATLGQTGCIVAWSDYREGATGDTTFGAGKPGDPALCVNPASPSGGRAMLKAYLPKPALAPAGDPPFVETIGQLSAACETSANGTTLRVRIEPGRYADLLGAAFDRATHLPSWGLHSLDMNLVQGNLIDMIAAQAAVWPGR